MEGYDINPLTGKPVKRGSVIWSRLVKKGLIQVENNKPKVITSKAYNNLSKEVVGVKKNKIEPEEETEEVEEPKRYIGGPMIKQQSKIVVPLATKVKKPLKEKVASVIEDTLVAYKECLRGIPDTISDDQLDLYIKEQLIKELKKSNNKYILRNINDLE